MHPTYLNIAIGIAVVLATAVAPATADSNVKPVRLFNLADLSGLTVVGLDLQHTTWTRENGIFPGEATSVTVDVSADVAVARHWVILARMPLPYLSIDGRPIDIDCCGFGLGNLTLGGRGLRWGMYGSGLRSAIGGELSVSLPTASDDGGGAFLRRMPRSLAWPMPRAAMRRTPPRYGLVAVVSFTAGSSCSKERSAYTSSPTKRQPTMMEPRYVSS